MVEVKFSLSDELAARFSVAYGRELNLRDGSDNPRNASMTEFKEKVQDLASEILYRQERKAQQDAIVVPAAEFS